VRVNGSVADFILAQLAEWGVERIYGVGGDAVSPLMGALDYQKKIEFITATNDANAAFMAAYEARLTGRLSVCTASAGPGAVSLLNGLADACLDGSPVLAVTGQVETKKIGARTKQYFDQQLLYRNFSKFTSLLIEPVSVAEILALAAREAYLDFSPAHISVPRDVFAKPVSLDTLPADIIEISKPPVFSGSNENIIEAFRDTKKPLIILGRGAEEALYQVLELSHKIGSGLIVAREAKSVIRGSFKRNLGGLGESYLPSIVNEADCLILIGNFPFEKQLFPAGIKIIQLAARPEYISVNAHAAASGDLGLLLEVIMHDLENYVVNQEWVGKIKEEALHIKQVAAQAKENKDRPIHPLRLMSALNQVVPPKSVITIDIGDLSHWFDLGYLVENQDVLLSSMWQSMGSGLPAAIGAKLAGRDRTVIAIIGEGGMIASMSELLTCVRYNLAITIIVVRDQTRSQALPTPDFVQLAQACGAEGFRIEDPAEIEGAIKKAVGSERTVLLEVITAPVKSPA
jgi:pyruvate dehydrogenase (quinone)/pyruvate oxidase